MAKIIGIGNALVDILVKLADEKPLSDIGLTRGGMWHIDEAQMRHLQAETAPLRPVRATGGSAANTIHALSMLGHATAYIGTVADDEHGRFFADSMRRRGTDSHLLMAHDGHTGIATTFILPDGERTFATYLGVAPQIDTTTLPFHTTAATGESDILHIEGYLVQDHDTVEEIMRQAKAAGMTVSYDLASWNIVRADRHFVRHLVRDYADIVFANHDEAEAYAGTSDPQTALADIAEHVQTAIVKMGKRGAMARRGTVEAFAPAEPCSNVADATGAGDFFAAGFLHGIMAHKTLDRCLRYGNIMAVHAIQVLGSNVPPLTPRQLALLDE